MDKKLLQKYNTPVPRYTSYPPANFFKDHFSADEYLEAVVRSNDWDPGKVSFYFHIPFCRKMCFYCGCNSCMMESGQTVERYFDALKTEFKMVSRFIDRSRQVSQIHFGGGTPNSVPPGYISGIMNMLHTDFSFGQEAEIAIECNPAWLDIPYMQQLKQAGFNRFSLGIQDFNERILKGVNRDPSVIPVKDLVSFLKSEDPSVTVNLDFIYGLPGQTIDSFSDTIQRAIDINPDRMVTFSYAHVPWVNKAQEKLEKTGLPDNDEKAGMYEKASRLLTGNGYKAIGLDHFVLEKDELFRALETGMLHRNFQGYCTRETTGQVYAFGVSAISQLQRVYAQNTKSVDDYIVSIANGLIPVRKGYTLNNTEIITREVITELMCNKQLNWVALAKRLSTTVNKIKETVSYNEPVMKQFQEDGIIDLSDDHIQVTDDGALFIRNVASSFDPLIISGNKKYSKPV